MVPEYLYKYRSWQIKYDKNLLEHNEIYLCSADSFNDPFDCKISVNYEGLSKDYVIKRNYEYLKKENPHIDRKERRKLARSQEKKKFYKDKDHLDWFEQYQKDYNASKIGIYSLSEDPKNIVMWSHYANSHKGICIGFDTRELINSFENIYKQTEQIIDLYKIQYQLEYPTLKIKDFRDDDDGIEKQIVTPLITKSNYWSYEKEYRLISITGVNFPIRLYNGIIKNIIMGCKINDNDKESIIKILQNKNQEVELFQAIKMENQFSLEFKKVIY